MTAGTSPRRKPGAVRTAFTGRSLPGGTGAAPYGAGNLGSHVGDDPQAVAANRLAAASAVGVRPGMVVFADQVHGREVAVVSGPQQQAVPGVDALVTATPGLAVAVLVADCLPVLLHDGDAGVGAAVHAGRRGVQEGVVAAAIDVARRLGARQLRGEIGPGICAACYQVGEQLRDEVVAAVPETFATARSGAPALDLRAGVRAQLSALGVPVVVDDDRCTAEDPDLYSYRRDGITGRGAGILVLG